MDLKFSQGSLVENLYGASGAIERYYCNLGINPEFIKDLQSGTMKITGRDLEGEIRVIEWPDHPFFLGTLYVPQARSLPNKPHPLVSGFLNAL